MFQALTVYMPTALQPAPWLTSSVLNILRSQFVYKVFILPFCGNFSHCCDQLPGIKTTSSRKCLFCFIVWGPQWLMGWGIVSVQSGCQAWSTVRKQSGAPFTSSLCSVQEPAHGVGPPAFRVGLPTSTKSLFGNARATPICPKVSPRWFQIKLTLKIHTCCP